MNIKRIINEEVDDFDWIRDVDPLDFNNCNWVIKVGNEKEYRQVEMFLFGRDWSWVGEEVGTFDDDYEPRFNLFFCANLENREFDAGSERYYERHLEGLTIHRWTNIQDAWNWGKSINESGDFDWVRQERDPWENISKEDMSKITPDEMSLISYIFEWDRDGWKYENNCEPYYDVLGIEEDESPDWSMGVYRGIERELIVYYKARCNDNQDWTYLNATINRDTFDWYVA